MEIQKGAVLLVRICNAFPHVSPLYVCISARLIWVGPRTRCCCGVPDPRSAVPSPLRSQHFPLTVSRGSTSAAFPKFRQRWGWGVLRLEALQPDRNRPREPSAPWPPATHRAPARRLLVAMLTALLWGLDGGF